MNPVFHNRKQLIVAAIVFLIVSWSVCAFSETIANDRFLDALSFVESRNRDSAIGKRGEVGRFQFSRVAWEQVSSQPFASATADHAARFSAQKYCLWLESQLRRELKRQPTHAEIYAAYNCGLTGFKRRGFKISKCPSITKRNIKIIEGKIHGI